MTKEIDAVCVSSIQMYRVRQRSVDDARIKCAQLEDMSRNDANIGRTIDLVN